MARRFLKERCGAPNCFAGMSRCQLPPGHTGNHAGARGANGWTNAQIEQRIADLELALNQELHAHLLSGDPAPVPMILHCPMCHARHLDKGEFTTKPHHTHACQGCGHCWRPAIVATVGVQFLPGFKDKETS